MLSAIENRFESAADSASSSVHRRVAVFAEYFPPYIGSDRRLFHLVESLRTWRPEYVITPPLRVITRRCERALFSYGDDFAGADSTVSFGGMTGRYLSLPRLIHHLYRRGGLCLQLAYALSLPILIRKALRHIKRMQPEAIIVGHPSFITGVVGVTCAKLAQIPVLLDYPDAWTPLAVETSGHRGTWVPRVMRRIERFVARRADRITSITALLAKSIRAGGARAPIAVVPNGADLRTFDGRNGSTHNDGTFRILYSGRLEKWAGTDNLIEVMAHVAASIGSRANFVFVGDGGGAAELRQAISSRGLQQYCTFLGFQPYDRMAHVLAQCDLAVLPFPDTAATRVSLPCKLFEYMAMGKPVIATDLPGIREVIPDHAVAWLKDANPRLLAQKILELEADPAQRKRYGDIGYSIVRTSFSWESLAGRFERELNALLPMPAHQRSAPLELAASSAPLQSP